MNDDCWTMTCDVPLFPHSPLLATARDRSGSDQRLKKRRRRTYGDLFDSADKGDFATAPTVPTVPIVPTVPSAPNSGTRGQFVSGDSSARGSDGTTRVTRDGGDTSSTLLNDVTIQERKRQARNRREQQRSVLISKQIMKLGEVIREANVVPLPPRPLKKIDVVTLAIDTIRILQAQIQTHTQEGELPAVVCG